MFTRLSQLLLVVMAVIAVAFVPASAIGGTIAAPSKSTAKHHRHPCLHLKKGKHHTKGRHKHKNKCKRRPSPKPILPQPGDLVTIPPQQPAAPQPEDPS